MNAYLSHHGILGQKWGVRRYRNADGSLTASGKARYNEDGTKKKASEMSDEELATANKRLQAERQYKDLTKSQSKSIAVKVGASVVGSMAAVGVASLVSGNTNGKQIATRMLAAGALGGIVAGATLAGGQVDRTYAGGKNK